MKKEYNNVDIQVITFDPASKILMAISDPEPDIFPGGGGLGPDDDPFD